MATATTCWNCGFENVPGARFCANCGKPQRQPCPECGADVSEGSRFCPNCGIPLAFRPPPAPAETTGPVLTAETRRVVSVLFADLAGSTGLTERLDPEAAREVIKKFYDVVQHIVERWYEGSIANYLGDGVLAVFGLPTAHEDDPERAVRAGLAIRDAMPNLNDHLRATHGVQLAVRVGVDTGEVVAASGSTFQRDFLVSDAVTTAARMQQTVGPGTVVVGERTYRLTKESIEYDDLPPLDVKGKERSLPVWAAVAPLPESAEVRRITAPLVGRHAELGLLRHLYARSRDDRLIHLVTIQGQPGVGKSRLLREFLAEVRDTQTPPLVLRGRGVAFGGQIGYHALIDILRGQAALLDTDTAEVVRSKLHDWLRDTLADGAPPLNDLLLTFGTTEQAPGEDPSLTRRRLFAAWKDLLLAMATGRAVVLAFEDLHWVDDGVLDLIEQFTEEAIEASLFIICLARPELRERRPSWTGGRRNTTTIELSPLRAREAEQLAAALSSDALTPEMRERIAQRAGGNPLFVEELVRMMLEGSSPGAAIPDTVQAVLTARIDRLPAIERRALQAAAVIGRAFWASAVAPIAGLAPAEVSGAIEELVRKELVVARPRSVVEREQEFAFRHILTRDVAYAMLPRGQRQRAHAAAAQWIESRLGERLEEVIEILAEHVREAGDDTRTAVYLQRAGNKARRLYANTDAIRLFTQALEAATKAGVPSAQTAAVYRDRGEVRQLRGEYQAAMEDFQAGLAEARRAGDLSLEAVLENLIGLIHHRQFRLEDAEAHFSRSIALAREINDRRTLGQSLVDFANIAWDRGQMPPDHPAITEGLALLREENDLAGEARALNLLCMGELGTGHGEQALQAAEGALAAARAAGDRSKEATSLSYLCVVNGFLGRYGEALPFGEAALRIAEDIGDRRRMVYVDFFMARILISHGKIAQAIEFGARSLEDARGMMLIQAPWHHYYQGLACYELGDLARARQTWDTGQTLESRSPAWRQIVLLCAIGVARLDRDPDALNRALDDSLHLPVGGFVPSDAEALLPVGEGLAEMERTDDLRRFLTNRRPGIERLQSPPNLAALAILDAHLALAAGRSADADALLMRAIQLSRDAEDMIRRRIALELRVQVFNRAEDQDALRRLLTAIADSLPEDMRSIFLASPRVIASMK